MKQSFWLFGLPFMVVTMGMIIIFSNATQITYARVETTGITGVKPVLQATPTCTTHTTGMTLTTSSTTPEVGDNIWVTVTLANEGCGQVGQLEYRLTLAQSAYVLVPDSPISITHDLALEPGETDTVTFSLWAIGAGEVTLQTSASFEVHLGYPGPAYWTYDSTMPISMTIPVTDTEIVVLQQAAYDVGCFPEIVHTGDTIYWFGCAVAAGHSSDAQIERFADIETAQTVFAARQGTLLLEPFHCYPAYRWEYEQEPIPRRQAWHSWLAERWIITTHSWDDTGIRVAPAPIVVSGAVYRAAIRNGLFLACDRLYLPVVCKR
jgi:hypothetical protein